MKKSMSSEMMGSGGLSIPVNDAPSIIHLGRELIGFVFIMWRVILRLICPSR